MGIGAVLAAAAAAPRRRSVAYSRFVAVTKWMLPAIAIVLIAVIASWPYMNPKTDLISIQSLIQGTVDAGGPSVVNARYLGSDDDGRPFTVSADRASNLSLDSQVIELTNPKADMSLDDGTWVFLTAERGRYDRADKALELTGAVDLFHDSGYEFRTTVAHVDLTQGLAWGDAPVSGQGTFGVLKAEGFRLRNNEKVIRFTGKSKLTLYPAAGEPKS
ncbi:MAG: LPS export ABC transporter periplasmic protein LptC [Hyphomicrobiales bacterium]|nr:LPS export ABC transporter periplasmic protein LptC [Hyphomicrobiales bacterium]